MVTYNEFCNQVRMLLKCMTDHFREFFKRDYEFAIFMSLVSIKALDTNRETAVSKVH